MKSRAKIRHYDNAATKKKHKTRVFFSNLTNFILSSFKSFYNDDCYLKAALLTFYTVISIVPFLALILSIAKGFGFEEFLQNEILKTFKEQKDILAIIIKFSYSFITNIKSNVIAGIGVIFLFISVFALFENIEKSLNGVWRIKKSRSFLKKIADYLSILIICPIFFVASSSLTIFLSSQLRATFENSAFVQQISLFLLIVLKITPFFLTCILFSFIYVFIPNTTIRIKTRLFAGLLAGIFFQFWQIAYIELQFALSSYNTIYGSFAALPLFLIWLQVDFIILLYGAEVAALLENTPFYKELNAKENLIGITTPVVAILILQTIGYTFLKGTPALSISEISKKLELPLFKIREVITILEKESVIARINIELFREEKYQLIINPEILTLKVIIDIVEKNLLEKIYVKNSRSLKTVTKIFDEYNLIKEKDKLNLSIKAIINQ